MSTELSVDQINQVTKSLEDIASSWDNLNLDGIDNQKLLDANDISNKIFNSLNTIINTAIKNNEKDERTDVYSLGAILYSILTFDTPLPNRDVREMLVDTIRGNIESPRTIKSQRYIPPAVEAIVLKAMNVKPEDRYHTVQDLRSDIINYMSGYATSAEHAGAVKHTFLFIERNLMPLLLTLTLCALLCLIGVIIYFVYNGNITF